VIHLSTDKIILGPWLCEKIDKIWSPRGCECVGLIRDDGTPLAATLIESYTGVCAEMHIAIEHAHVPLRRFIVAGFHYVFVDLGCKQVIGRVSSANKKALNFDLRLGFEPIAVIPDVFRDGSDMVILRMLREQCPWIAREERAA
jgi:hypothetical protein